MNWTLLKNSLLVAGLTTLLAGGLGLLAALWLTGLGVRWRNRCLAVAVMALALPPFLVTNCWLHYLGHTGVWRGWLPLNIFSLGGTVWILSLLLWPITLVAAWSAWQRLDAAQLESDPALSGLALMRWLLLPLARPALGLAAVLTFVLALNNFAVPAILQVKVFPAELWVRFSTNFDAAGALWLSWPMIAMPLLLVVVFWRSNVAWPHIEGAVSARAFRRQLGAAGFWFCGVTTILLCALAVGLPLLQLVSAPRTWNEMLPALSAGQSAVWNSFAFAALAATAAVALGLVGWHWRVGGVLWLPLLVPGVLLGIGLITLLNRPVFSVFYQSAGIVVLAFVLRYLALGWNGAAHALRAVDRDLTDAARLSGASRWQLLRHVQWPQAAPQLAAAWYVTYLLCLWDVESIVLIVPPGGETLALRVFNLLHYGHNAQVNALCLALLGLAVAPLLVWRLATCVRLPAPQPRQAGDQRSESGHPPSNVQRSSKPQPPSSRESSGSNVQIAAVRSGIGARNLMFLWMLALGGWCFCSGCSPRSDSREAPVESRIFSRVQVIGTRGVAIGQFNKPRSLAVDKRDNLYVADMTGRVQKFSPDGRWLLSWQMPQTDLGKPKGMSCDSDGNIIVIEPHYQRLNHFSPEGKLVGQWGTKGTNAGCFTLPRSVAVNSRGEIFVSEYMGEERVQRFALKVQSLPLTPALSPSDGERENHSQPPALSVRVRLLQVIGKAGTGPGEFNRPEGLAVDAQDRIYVADSCNHRIQVFAADGRWLRSYGKAGSGSGELSYPFDLRVDASGLQFICEFGNSRIQVFDERDRLVEILGGPGAAPGQFSNPWAIALDSGGNLYVADAQNHRVQKFIRRTSALRDTGAVAEATPRSREPRTTDNGH